jgi:RimJ/RimL family protein N-acetyltransferase
VRVATEDDIEEIVVMAMTFLSESPYRHLGDEESIRNVVTTIVTADKTEKIMLIEENVGFLAGTVTPFIFGGQLMATEIAWYLYPDQRGSKIGSDFLGAFEHWAKEIAGCQMISMGCLDDRLMKYYEDKGYKLYERAFMKVF